MAQITFPGSPTVGDQHVAENGVKYEWTGLAWRVIAPAVVPGGGTITAVNPGVGLSGGGDNGDVTLDIEPVGVEAGDYGDASHFPKISVNAQGQVIGVELVALPDMTPPGVFPNPVTFDQGILFNGQFRFIDMGQNRIALLPIGDSTSAPVDKSVKVYLYSQYTDANNWARVTFDFQYGDLAVYREQHGTVIEPLHNMTLWFDSVTIRGGLDFFAGGIGDPSNPSKCPTDVYIGSAGHAPTPPPGASDDRLATTEFVTLAIAAALAARGAP